MSHMLLDKTVVLDNCIAADMFLIGPGLAGKTDVNAPSTIASAWAGGFSRVDVYIFPCFSCGNPSSQVTRTGQLSL